MRTPTHPGRLLKRELAARAMSANRLGFWLDLQSQRDLGVLEAEHGKEIKAQVRTRPSAP